VACRSKSKLICGWQCPGCAWCRTPDKQTLADACPNRHPGLPTWVRANRPIARAYTVPWCTPGMRHIVRAEDWPIMPAVRKKFEPWN
jgi:hypothetical protein